VGLYSRPQVVVLLVVVGVAGLGLAVGAWRERYPDLVERVERFDLEPADPAAAGRQGSGQHHRTGRQPDVRSAEPAATRPPPPPEGPDGDGHGSGRGGAAEGLDLNQASAAELTGLPGLGPILAARIVDTREREGAFPSVDDLRRVRGLGAARIERLRPLLTVGARSE
jgi:competence ComEA-like helix-hairpin-helix protein